MQWLKVLFWILLLIENAWGAWDEQNEHHRRLVGPDAGDIEVHVYTSQSTSLRRIFEPLDVTSSLYLNWDFETEALVQYCFFIGVECDNDGYVSAIDLTGQMLEGPLPDHFSALSRLRRIKVFDNELTGRLPPSLLSLTHLNNLNIGHNSFSGPFPTLQKSLTRVILDRNSFSGVIPTSLCQLSGLESLDMTALTRMTGLIPSCLGSLTALTKLRITDVGLAGPIPPSLCAEREMNGLLPNTFGCDAIACPPGQFQRPAGRVTGPDAPCLKCDVPSNAIGSSFCQWHATLEKTNEPTTSPRPSSFPTVSPTFAWSEAPSTPPELHPSEQPSFPPTNLQTITSVSPSAGPSVSPTGRPSVIQITRSPHASVVSNSNESKGRKWSVTTAILVPVFLCILIPLFAARYSRQHSKGMVTENTELLSPDATRSTDNSLEGSLDKISVQELEASNDTAETIVTTKPDQPSPSSCRKVRKVRFNCPETIPEDPSGERLAALSGSFDEERPVRMPPPETNDTIDSWFSNPVFYPIRSCQQLPCGTTDASTTSVASCSIGINENHEQTGRHSPSTITMDAASSGDELEAVLGIREPPLAHKRSTLVRPTLTTLIPSDDASEGMIVYDLDDRYHDVMDEELKIVGSV